MCFFTSKDNTKFYMVKTPSKTRRLFWSDQSPTALIKTICPICPMSFPLLERSLQPHHLEGRRLPLHHPHRLRRWQHPGGAAKKCWLYFLGLKYTLQETNISHPWQNENHLQKCLGMGYVRYQVLEKYFGFSFILDFKPGEIPWVEKNHSNTGKGHDSCQVDSSRCCSGLQRSLFAYAKKNKNPSIWRYLNYNTRSKTLKNLTK